MDGHDERRASAEVDASLAAQKMAWRNYEASAMFCAWGERTRAGGMAKV